ncbi:MAG TPA: tetratricopeptide repeat protein [Gemmatimonadaceae bacterium]|nr:tetratricopeptide repeat protein [Gemmatimonadaceae bacterium]
MRRNPALTIRGIRSATAFLAFAALGAAACGDSREEPVRMEPTIAVAEPAPVTTVVADGTVATPRFVVPENVSYEMAETAFLDKRYEEAVAMFEVYSANRPRNPWGQYMLGLSTWKFGERERAVEAFESALALDPTHVKSMLNLGRVLLELGRAEEALVKVEAALAADSSAPEVYRLLGRAYGELGRTDESLESYRHAIVLDEKDVWSMNNMGFVLIQQGRHEEALGPLARAVELRGDVAVFRNNLGIALEGTGQFTLAIEQFRKVVELDETYVKASVSLTRVEELRESPDTVPIDLSEIARRFIDEVKSVEIPHDC